jgi:hypothetical protein
MSSTYQIRLYDRPLVTFSVVNRGEDQLAGDVEWVDQSARFLLPPTLIASCNFSNVMDWLARRLIPEGRYFADRILTAYGPSAKTVLGRIDISMGLSLNDSYWVTPDGFDGTWSNFNFYDNAFDEAVGTIAFGGRHDGRQRHPIEKPSPELTTGGSYPKAWRRVGEDILLYKAGNYPLFQDCANDDLGPYSEYFSAQVAEAAGLHHVTYGLDTWKSHLASTCKLFCDEDHSFVSFYDATQSFGVQRCLVACAKIGQGVLESYLDMLVFDSVILNEDRHTGNFGFVRENTTGRFIGFAPLFDHNQALFPTDMDQDVRGWTEMAGYITPSGSTVRFDDLVPPIITERQHEWLGRLLDFSPIQNDRYPISETRLRGIGELVRARASKMFRLQPHDLEEVWKSVSRLGDELGDSGPDMPILICDDLTGERAEARA